MFLTKKRNFSNSKSLIMSFSGILIKSNNLMENSELSGCPPMDDQIMREAILDPQSTQKDEPEALWVKVCI